MDMESVAREKHYSNLNARRTLQLRAKHVPMLIKRDLMAERLARRAEDREVPGSSPTRD